MRTSSFTRGMSIPYPDSLRSDQGEHNVTMLIRGRGHQPEKPVGTVENGLESPRRKQASLPWGPGGELTDRRGHCPRCQLRVEKMPQVDQRQHLAAILPVKANAWAHTCSSTQNSGSELSAAPSSELIQCVI